MAEAITAMDIITLFPERILLGVNILYFNATAKRISMSCEIKKIKFISIASVLIQLLMINKGSTYLE